MSPRRIRVLTTLAELDSLADAWRKLWDSCIGMRTPYLSFEWVRSWAAHFGMDGRLRVIAVEKDLSLVGVMPLMLTDYRLWPFKLEALETVGKESRNLVALLSPDHGSEVLQALASCLMGGLLDGRRILRIALVPSAHPLLSELAAAIKGVDERAQLVVRGSDFAPYVPLPSTWEGFLRTLSKRRVKVLARAQKRLDLARHEVKMRQCTGDDVEPAMLRLFELHDARWSQSGIRGLFHDRRNRTFHLDVARQCDRMEMLDLSELVIDGVTASVHFVCVLDGIAHMMRSGRDTSFAEYDVGHLHDLRLFRKWIAQRQSEADFLRGAEPYKFYWTRRYRSYNEMLAAPPIEYGGVHLRMAYWWMRLARFLAYRHPPKEIFAYLRMRRFTRQELKKMGVHLKT